ncbi:Uncharacterised protein [uncultured archaeon]|nr:Uncharacterised protein [uncultured archaeon]
MAQEKLSEFCLYLESDSKLAEKFHEADFGFSAGGQLVFHPLEAAYLVKLGKTKFDGKSFAQFMAAQKKKHRMFPFAFAVYSLVRSKGRVVRPYMEGIKYLRAYAPGAGRQEGKSSLLIALLPGRLAGKDIEEQVALAHKLRLDLIIAYGTEKEPKFYKVAAFNF